MQATYRGSPIIFRGKFQRSPFFRPSKSENSDASLIPKPAPPSNWKREETKQLQQIPLEAGVPTTTTQKVSTQQLSGAARGEKLVINQAEWTDTCSLYRRRQRQRERAGKWARAELCRGNAAPARCQITHTEREGETHAAAPGERAREGGEDETEDGGDAVRKGALHCPASWGSVSASRHRNLTINQRGDGRLTRVVIIFSKNIYIDLPKRKRIPSLRRWCC